MLLIPLCSQHPTSYAVTYQYPDIRSMFWGEGWWCIPDKAVFLLDVINLVCDITNADVAQLPILAQGKMLKWYTILIVHLMPWSLHVISSTQAFSHFSIASDRCWYGSLEHKMRLSRHFGVCLHVFLSAACKSVSCVGSSEQGSC